MDTVFKALADASRRHLLDLLFAEDGQALSDLCGHLHMSRQAVSKHLHILEQAGLVLCHREGRRKLHYLNPAPIQDIAGRWIDKYAGERLAALAALRTALGQQEEART